MSQVHKPSAKPTGAFTVRKDFSKALGEQLRKQGPVTLMAARAQQETMKPGR